MIGGLRNISADFTTRANKGEIDSRSLSNEMSEIDMRDNFNIFRRCVERQEWIPELVEKSKCGHNPISYHIGHGYWRNGAPSAGRRTGWMGDGNANILSTNACAFL